MKLPPIRITAGMFAVFAFVFAFVALAGSAAPIAAGLGVLFSVVVWWAYVQGFEDGARHKRLLKHQLGQVFAARQRVEEENNLLRERVKGERGQ
jgi:hypothetical protein